MTAVHRVRASMMCSPCIPTEEGWRAKPRLVVSWAGMAYGVSGFFPAQPCGQNKELGPPVLNRNSISHYCTEVEGANSISETEGEFTALETLASMGIIWIFTQILTPNDNVEAPPW